MLRLLSPPGIVTGVVVMLSVVSGVAFGAAVAGLILTAATVAKRARA